MFSISEMPALEAEDQGFLLHLKYAVLDEHLESLGLSSCTTLNECIDSLFADSSNSEDVGAELPLYIPVKDDSGEIQGYKAKPVWAGAHIDIPLYGSLCSRDVEALIYGNNRSNTGCCEQFMSYNPAFRVALLVHHICQIVVINPLAAEAFVLNKYGELHFEDRGYSKTGVPSTELFSVEPNIGTRIEWSKSANSLVGTHKLNSRINGWRVYIRGSQPKQTLLKAAWQEIRSRLDLPIETSILLKGEKLSRAAPADSGRTRKRTDSPEVDVMINWVKEMLETGNFPMRGQFKDWKQASLLFSKAYPTLAERWSSDAMRKAYERRKRRGY